MKEMVKLISVLTIICVLSGSMLAFVNDLTKDRIMDLRVEKEMGVLKEVMPQFDNKPAINTLIITENNTEYTFFVARLQNAYSGVAFKTASQKGFGGEVAVMVGLNADGSIKAVKIMDNKESPEQSKGIQSDGFTQQFIAKSIENTVWKLKKDKGDIDGVTQATISSRAVMDAIDIGRDVYMRNMEKIKATCSN